MTPLNGAKKRKIRKQILQQASDLYLHPLPDRVIAENLKPRFPTLTSKDIVNLATYLEKKNLITLRKSKSGQLIQITAEGIDVLDGSLIARGVEPSNKRLTKLEYKKEIRREIISYCYSFQEFFNEDSEILEEFRKNGFANLLLEEIRFHLWYLNQKNLVDLKTFSVGGEQLFMVRLTAKGIETMENGRQENGEGGNEN